MLLIVIQLLTVWTSCIEYHLETTVQLTTTSAKKISMIQDRLVILDSNYIFTIFEGINFSTFWFQGYIQNQRNVTFTANNYYFCYLNYLYAYEYRNYQTYDSTNLNGAITSLLTPNYSLFSLNQPCAEIRRLDMKNGSVNIFNLETGPNCIENGYGNFSNPGRDIIFFSISSSLYVLDNSSLQIIQKLPILNLSGLLIIDRIDSLYDQNVNLIILQVHSSQTVKKYYYSNNSKILVELAQLYNPDYNFTLLDSTQAISFRYHLYNQPNYFVFNYWKDYQNIILSLNLDNLNNTQQIMFYRQYCALSNKEDVYVLRDTIGQADNLYFYTLTQSLQIVFLFQVILPNNNQFTELKAKFTKGDEYLIVLQSNPQQNTSKLTKINTTSQQYITISNNVTLDFFFPAADDRIVLLSTGLNSSSYFSLQIAFLSNQSLISQLLLPLNLFGYNYLNMALEGSEIWQNYFILYLNNNTNQRIISYFYSQDTVTPANNEINFSISYPTLRICNKYFIIVNSGVLSVFNSSGFDKVMDITLQFPYSGNFYSDKDMLVVEDFYFTSYNNIKDNSGTVLYDFSKEPKQWFQGTIYKRYRSFIVAPPQNNYVFFSRRKLFYYFRSSKTSSDPIKVIYNMSNMPINRLQFVNSIDGRSSENTQSFVATSFNSSNCSFIFFLEPYSRLLRRFNSCKQGQQDTYQLQTFPSNCVFWTGKTLLTSSGRHIVVMLKGYAPGGYPYFRAEIRYIENPDIIAYIYYIPNLNVGTYWPTFDFDNSENHFQAIIQWQIQITDEPKAELRENYGFNFQTFQANQQFLVIAGMSSTNPSLWIIVSKPISSLTETFRTNLTAKVQMLGLNTDGSLVSAFANNTAYVWSTVNGSLLYSCQRINLTILSIRFMNSSHFLLQFTNSFEVISLVSAQTIFSQPSMNKVAAISPNGEFIAHVVSFKQAAIYTSEGVTIANFIVPQLYNISCLTFSSNNSLIIASDGNPTTIFTLVPFPCPPTFYNERSICICSQNTTLQANVCKCKPNFASDSTNTTCSCPSDCQFKNETCNPCRGNMTIIDLSCQCKPTYIFNSDSNSCQCHSSTILQEDICVCTSGYMQSNVCYDCSSLCSGGCVSSGLSGCNSYSSIFYIITIGGGVITTIAISIAVKIYRKRKNQQSNLTHETKSDKNIEENSLMTKL